MKKLLIGSCFAIFLLTGCKKIKLAQKIELDPTGQAWIKVGHFMPVSGANNRPLQITIDGQRIGISIGTGSTATPYPLNYLYGFPAPGGGYNTLGSVNPDYYAVPAGTHLLTLAVPKAGTNQDSIIYFNGSITLAPDIRQTVMLTDTGTAAVATVITDLIADPFPGNARAKFFNGIPDGGAIDLYITPSGGSPTLLAGSIAYRATSGYFEFPAGTTTLNFKIVKAGLPVTSFLAEYNFAASQAGRVYTIFSRGYSVLSTTDSRGPRVSIVVNR